jgi:hypothetical protein
MAKKKPVYAQTEKRKTLITVELGPEQALQLQRLINHYNKDATLGSTVNRSDVVRKAIWFLHLRELQGLSGGTNDAASA